MHVAVLYSPRSTPPTFFTARTTLSSTVISFDQEGKVDNETEFVYA